MKRRAKIFASLAALFVLGGVSGGILGVSTERTNAAQKAVESEWAGRTLAEYQERLRLTPGQVAKLQPEFKKTSSELRDIRRETVLKLRTAIKANSSRVMQELTPEQRDEFRKLLEERRERVQAEHKRPPK